LSSRRSPFCVVELVALRRVAPRAAAQILPANGASRSGAEGGGVLAARQPLPLNPFSRKGGGRWREAARFLEHASPELARGGERYFAIRLTVLILSIAFLTASLTAAPLGQFEDHAEVGSPKLAGSATYDADSQEYSVSAGGSNMWANRDELHFLWNRMKGDFILQARVQFIGKGVDPHRKLGWIARSTLDEDSPYADATVHGDGLTSLQFRRAKGAITDQVRSTVTAPDF